MPVQRAQVIVFRFVLGLVTAVSWLSLAVLEPAFYAIVFAPMIGFVWWSQFFGPGERAVADARGVTHHVFRTTSVPWSLVTGITYVALEGSIFVTVRGSRSLRISRSQRPPTRGQREAAAREVEHLESLRRRAVSSADDVVTATWRKIGPAPWVFVGVVTGVTALLAFT